MPISPKQAVLRGHLLVTLPILAIIAIGVVAGPAIFGSSPPGLGALIAAVLGWLWWSFAIPRWRRWADAQTGNPDAVQRLGQQTFLVWKRGSPFEKTEIK
jgi:hypothetical protein